MKIRPGRNLIRAAIGVVAIPCLAIVWPAVLWLLPIAVLAIASVSVLEYRRLASQWQLIQVERSMPTTVRRGIAFHVEIAVTSHSNDALHIALRDVVPDSAVPRFAVESLVLTPADKQQVVRTSYVLPLRGRFEFGAVWLRLRGPFNFLEAQQSYPVAQSIKVLPERFGSKEGLKKDERAELLVLDKPMNTRLHGTGTDFESLQEYRLGDDPRRIDWRTTARCRYPVVRRYQIERHRDVMILIDCGRLMGADAGQGSKLDCAVDAGLLLARVALEGGDRCGLGVFDDQVLGYLPPVYGMPFLRWLAEAVYDVQTRWRESDFGPMFATLQRRQSKRSLVVVLSDMVDPETSGRFATSLKRLSQRHVVLLAAIRTPALNAGLATPVESLLDGSRKAVLFRLLRDRQRGLRQLSRAGVQVVDVEPDELVVPLINRFIELRERNL